MRRNWRAFIGHQMKNRDTKEVRKLTGVGLTSVVLEGKRVSIGNTTWEHNWHCPCQPSRKELPEPSHKRRT